MVYKRVQKKSSSSSPAFTNEANKSKFRQPSFGIQPQTDTDSSPQESPSYSQEPHEYRSTNALSRVVANLQRQALVEAQPSQLEPEAQADEVSNEAVEIQHQNESAESGDEDSNTANGGTIQRSCSECQSEPEEEKTASEPPQFYTVQRQSKYLHQKPLIQAKLTIGAPGDKYEQEADSMAARVMSMDAPTTNPQTIQRQGEEQHESIQQQPPVSPFVQRVGELVQRMAEVKASTDETVVNSNKEPLFSGKQDNLESTQLEYLQAKHINRVNARPGTEATYLDNRSHTETSTAEESVIQPLTDETLQRSVQDDTNSATPSLEGRLGSQTGGGSPLDEQTRSFMESGFGADFSQVKVHTDTTAVQMNKELGAQAFTHGHDVYFGEGKAPGKNELTAHELTHVVQQGGALRMNKEPLAAKKSTIQQAPEKFNQELRLNPLSNLWNRGNRFVKNAWSNTRKTVSNGTKYAKNAWNKTTKTASNLASSATKYAKNAWNHTTKTASNLASSATKYAKNAWNNTTKTARNLASSATKYAKNAWNHTTKTARNLTGRGIKYAKNAWNHTTKTARNLTGRGTKYAKNAWNTTAKTVKNLAGRGTKYAKNAWNTTAKTVKNLAGRGTKYAKNAWNTTAKTVKNLAGRGTKYAKNAWNTTAKTVSDWGENTRSLVSKGNKFVNNTWDKAGNAYNKTKSKMGRFGGVLDVLTGDFSQPRNAIKEGGKKFDKWWDKTKPNWGALGDIADFYIGEVKAVGDMADGLLSLQQSLNVLRNPVYRLTHPQEARQADKQILDNATAVSKFVIKHPEVLTTPGLLYHAGNMGVPKAVWDGLTKSYRDAIKAGHPGQAVGRLVVDIGSLFVGGEGVLGKVGEAGKIAKGGEILGVEGRVVKIAKGGEVLGVDGKIAQEGGTAIREGEKLLDSGKVGSEVSSIPKEIESVKSPVTKEVLSDGRSTHGNKPEVEPGGVANLGDNLDELAKAANNDIRYMKNRPVKPIERTFELSINKQAYAEKIAKKYGINLKGANGQVKIVVDSEIAASGITRYSEKGEIIRISEDLLRRGDEAEIANTIAHELSHARDFQRSHKAGITTLKEAEAKRFEKLHGGDLSVDDGSVYGAGNALEEYIKGNR